MKRKGGRRMEVEGGDGKGLWNAREREKEGRRGEGGRGALSFKCSPPQLPLG